MVQIDADYSIGDKKKAKWIAYVENVFIQPVN